MRSTNELKVDSTVVLDDELAPAPGIVVRWRAGRRRIEVRLPVTPTGSVGRLDRVVFDPSSRTRFRIVSGYVPDYEAGRKVVALLHARPFLKAGEHLEPFRVELVAGAECLRWPSRFELWLERLRRSVR